MKVWKVLGIVALLVGRVASADLSSTFVDDAPVGSLARRLTYCLDGDRADVLARTRLETFQCSDGRLQVGSFKEYQKRAKLLMDLLKPQVFAQFLEDVQLQGMKNAALAIIVSQASDANWSRSTQNLEKIADDLCTRPNRIQSSFDSPRTTNACSPQMRKVLGNFVKNAAPSLFKKIPAKKPEQTAKYLNSQFAAMNVLLKNIHVPYSICKDYSEAMGRTVHHFACPPPGYDSANWDRDQQIPLALTGQEKDKWDAYSKFYEDMISTVPGVLAVTPALLNKAGFIRSPYNGGIVGVGHPDRDGIKTATGITGLQFKLHGDGDGKVDFTAKDIQSARQNYVDEILAHVRNENDNVWEGTRLKPDSNPERSAKQALLDDGVAAGQVASDHPDQYVELLCRGLQGLIGDKQWTDTVAFYGKFGAAALVSMLVEADPIVLGGEGIAAGGVGLEAAVVSGGSLATRLGKGAEAIGNLAKKAQTFLGGKGKVGEVAAKGLRGTSTFAVDSVKGSAQLVAGLFRTFFIRAPAIYTQEKVGMKSLEVLESARIARLRKTQYYLSFNANDRNEMEDAIKQQGDVTAELPGTLGEAASVFLLPAKWGGIRGMRFR